MRLRWTTPQPKISTTLFAIFRDNPNAAGKVAETSTRGAASCWISLVRAAGDGSKEPENWCSRACLTLWYIAFKIRIWRLCASIMERKTGLETPLPRQKVDSRQANPICSRSCQPQESEARRTVHRPPPNYVTGMARWNVEERAGAEFVDGAVLHRSGGTSRRGPVLRARRCSAMRPC